jgi:cyclopropane fatty-acyl-phospholipid synthase-like methyltransferase
MEKNDSTQESTFYPEWWNCPEDGGDAGMEAEHLDHWEHVLSYIDYQIKNTDAVLDFGCNRGGFMRLLYDHSPFAEGIGIDRASDSLAHADASKGTRPFKFELSSTADSYERYFDMAVSTSVIYLIDDLEQHAKTMFRALKPGGSYYAQHPDYTSYENQKQLVDVIDKYAAIPTQLNSLDDIAKAFADAGFKVAIRRIPPRGFVPYQPGGLWYSSIYHKLSASYDHAYMFKLTRPS